MQEEAADEIWMSKFQQLLEYYKEHGNSLVPQHYQYNKRLGSWVAAQRKAYRMLQKGKAVPIAQMNDWKIQQLESIEFVWYVGRNRDKILAQLELEKKQGNGNGNGKGKGKAVLLKKNNKNNKNKKRQAQEQPSAAPKKNKQEKKKKMKIQQTNHIRLKAAPSALELCVNTNTTELNDNDLELARLIANFPNASNVVLDDDDDDDDEEQEAEQEAEQVITTQKYYSRYTYYQEMNEYLNTIANLQDEVFSLQQELFALKSTTSLQVYRQNE